MATVLPVALMPGFVGAGICLRHDPRQSVSDHRYCTASSTIARRQCASQGCSQTYAQADGKGLSLPDQAALLLHICPHCGPARHSPGTSTWAGQAATQGTGWLRHRDTASMLHMLLIILAEARESPSVTMCSRFVANRTACESRLMTRAVRSIRSMVSNGCRYGPAPARAAPPSWPRPMRQGAHLPQVWAWHSRR